MAYLYAGMGIAMLTGIMAMFEMATSYMQFQNTWRPASVASSILYYKGLQLKDENIIAKKSGLEVCEFDDFDDNKDSFDLDSSYQFNHPSAADFQGGCSYASSSHRIIFDSNKGLWSCALPSGHPGNPGEKCDFEK